MTEEYQQFLEKTGSTIHCRFNSTKQCTLKCMSCPIFEAAMKQLFIFESIILNQDIDEKKIGTTKVNLTSGGTTC